MKFTRYDVQGKYTGSEASASKDGFIWLTIPGSSGQLAFAEQLYLTTVRDHLEQVAQDVRTDLVGVRLRKVEIQEKYETIREFHPADPAPGTPIRRIEKFDPDGSTAYYENWYCTLPLPGARYKVTEHAWRLDEGAPPERDIFGVTFDGSYRQ